MSARVIVGVFEYEDDVLAATRAARLAGLRIADVYAPYAVHGMEEAMGLPRSRLPWICFVYGLLGVALKTWFEYWTTAVSWPLNVGGKPWDSLPAFIPVSFEVMVASAGLSTVAVFFYVSRLIPGKVADVPHPRVTDDRFLLMIDEADASFDLEKATRLLREHHALEVEERHLATGSRT